MTITKYYCDICKEKTDKVYYFRVGFGNNDYSNYYYREFCKKCLGEIIIPYIQLLGLAKELKFEQVGTLEQGGVQCPVCKHLNNGYTFKGKCAECGFEKPEEEKENV